jgi:hypothetical protein
MRISHQIQQFEFQHLYYLKIDEVELLFKELGLSELGLSLVGVSKKILRVLLNRLGHQEARSLIERIKRFNAEEGWLKRDAKYSVLEVGMENKGADIFLKELGMVALSKAFVMSDSFLFETLKQKLSPSDASLFRRYFEGQLSRFEPEKTAQRKNFVLNHIQNHIPQYFRKEAA